MAETIKYRFRCRRRTAANWTTINEILLAQEIGLESDTGLGKVGDGVTPWNSLLYTIVGQVDLTGIADGKCLAWDATNGVWKIANRGAIYQPGTGIAIDSSNPEAPIISSTLGSLALDGTADTYADLPTGLGPSDDGTTYLNLEDGLVYVWNGSAWPAEGEGIRASGGGAGPGELEGNILSHSPLAYWKLNESSGTTFFDSSGNGFDLTKNGTVLMASDLARIVPADPSFKGLYINTATSGNSGGGSRADRLGLPAPYTGDYTICAIVMLNSKSTLTRLVFALYATGETQATNADLYFNLAGNVVNLLWEYNSGTNYTLISNLEISNPQPYFLTIFRDSVNQATGICINGRLTNIGSYTSGQATNGGSATTVRVGDSLDGGNAGGYSLAHVAVFDKLLSLKDIADMAIAAGF